MGTLNSWDTTDANNSGAPPAGWPENMNYSEVNDTGRAVQGTMKRFFADIGGSLAAGGSNTAYTVTLNETGYSAYFDGMIFACSVPADNAASGVTMNVNSIGAKNIKDVDGNNPVAGMLVTGGVYMFVYDGTNFVVSGDFGGVTALRSYSEQSKTTAASGAITIDTAVATYHYTPGLTGIPTFTFSNPASAGRLTSFTLELNNAANYLPVWPASVDWPYGAEPTWTAGKDVVTFTTRDAGTTWLGFAAGLSMS